MKYMEAVLLLTGTACVLAIAISFTAFVCRYLNGLRN